MPQFSARFNAPTLCNALKNIERFRDKKAIIPICEGYLFEAMSDETVFVLGKRSFVALKKTLAPEVLSPLQAIESVFFLNRESFVERVTSLIGEPYVETVLTACEGVVRVAASDTYVGGFIYVTAIITQHGAFSVHSKMLDFLKEVGSVDIAITELENQWASIKYKKTTYKIPGMPAGDMANLIRIPAEDSKLTTMPADAFMDCLKTASPFKGEDESRLFINGVNIQKRDENIAFAATDGYRLCLLLSKASMADTIDVTFSNRLLDSLVIEDADIVSVYKDDKFTYLQFDNSAFFSSRHYNEVTFVKYQERLIDPFPNESFIPVTVSQVDLVSALKRILVVCNDSYHMILTATPGKVELSVPDNAFGEGRESIDASMGDLGYKLTKHGIDCLCSADMPGEEVEKIVPFIDHAITSKEKFLENLSKELASGTLKSFQDSLLQQAEKKRVGFNGKFFLQQVRLFDKCDTLTIKFPLDKNAPILLESTDDVNIIQMILRMND